ncbi:ankyrin repeat-containing domain protein [Neurospora crassa]|nr:ankyrin repeat-containing domain protein [Neurospora crassa]
MEEDEQSRKDTFQALADALRVGDLFTVFRLCDTSEPPIPFTTTSISPYLPTGRSPLEPVQCQPLGVAAMFSHPEVVSQLLSIPKVVPHIDDPVFNLCKCPFQPVDTHALADYGVLDYTGHWTAWHLVICPGKDIVHNYVYGARIIPPDYEPSLQIVKDLLKAGASLTEVDINARDHEGRTPLHYVALRYSSSSFLDKDKGEDDEGGDLSCIKLLLSAGANPEIRDNYSQTPFNTALNFGCLFAAKHLLLEGGAKHQFRFLCLRTNRLCYPLQTDFDLLDTINRLSPPDRASSLIDCGRLEESITMEEDENQVLHPLTLAAGDGSNPATAVSFFLSHGADPNARSGYTKGRWGTAMHKAILSNPRRPGLMLLKFHPDYDPETGRIHAIGPDASVGARIRTPNSEGHTVLDLAIHRSELHESVDQFDHVLDDPYRNCTYKFVGALLFSLIQPYKKDPPPQPLLDAEDMRYLAEKLREVIVRNPVLAYEMVAAGVHLAVLMEQRHEVGREAMTARKNGTLTVERVDPFYAMNFVRLLVTEANEDLELAVMIAISNYVVVEVDYVVGERRR